MNWRRLNKRLRDLCQQGRTVKGKGWKLSIPGEPIYLEHEARKFAREDESDGASFLDPNRRSYPEIGVDEFLSDRWNFGCLLTFHDDGDGDEDFRCTVDLNLLKTDTDCYFEVYNSVFEGLDRHQVYGWLKPPDSRDGWRKLLAEFFAEHALSLMGIRIPTLVSNCRPDLITMEDLCAAFYIYIEDLERHGDNGWAQVQRFVRDRGNGLPRQVPEGPATESRARTIESICRMAEVRWYEDLPHPSIRGLSIENNARLLADYFSLA